MSNTVGPLWATGAPHSRAGSILMQKEGGAGRASIVEGACRAAMGMCEGGGAGWLRWEAAARGPRPRVNGTLRLGQRWGLWAEGGLCAEMRAVC